MSKIKKFFLGLDKFLLNLSYKIRTWTIVYFSFVATILGFVYLYLGQSQVAIALFVAATFAEAFIQLCSAVTKMAKKVYGEDEQTK